MKSVWMIVRDNDGDIELVYNSVFSTEAKANAYIVKVWRENAEDDSEQRLPETDDECEARYTALHATGDWATNPPEDEDLVRVIDCTDEEIITRLREARDYDDQEEAMEFIVDED